MGHIEALNSNSAVAYGAMLSRVQVVCAYPITPQVTIVEYLASFINDGLLKAEYVEAEGEYGMVAATMGAAATGARAFTATCSQGFAYAYESITAACARRVPIVMAIVNRPINGFWPDHTDSLSGRDWPWLQFYAEHAQEALDNVIMAYKVAEDWDVHLPTMVCNDGFYTSYVMEPVDIPEQDEVDEFLPPFKPRYIRADPSTPASPGIFASPRGLPPSIYNVTLGMMAWRLGAEEALVKAKEVIKKVNYEFGKKFGRSYGNGLVEEYMTEDAEVAFVTMGSMTGPARIAVDELRNKGKKVGLIKLKSFRPFPIEDFKRLGKGLKALVVCDRNVVNTGYGGVGASYLEIKHSLWYEKERPLLFNFILGLCGVEVSPTDYIDIIDMTSKALETGIVDKEVVWYPPVELKIYDPEPIPEEKRIKPCWPGTTLCQGCAEPLIFRHIFETLGRNVVVVPQIGCGAWSSNLPGSTAVTVPFEFSWLPQGPAVCSGISRGLKALGKEEGIHVILIAGDGSYGDMGFMTASGAMERNENVLVVCFDNEAYMNTGRQRSGATPYKASTMTTPVGTVIAGKQRPKKDLPKIHFAHGIPYVATATVAFLADFKMKLKKAASIRGYRYIHVLSPCPTGWGFPTERSIEVSRLSVQSGIFPLYEIDHGKFRFTYKPKERIPVKDYLQIQSRFRHLKDEDIKEIQSMTEEYWAELEELEKTEAT